MKQFVNTRDSFDIYNLNRPLKKVTEMESGGGLHALLLSKIHMK